MKRLLLCLLLVAVAAPVATTCLGCRVSGEIDNPND